MSDKPISEIVGRQEGAKASAAGVTSAKPSSTPAVAPKQAEKAGETQVGQVQSEAAPAVDDPLAGLKSALDKERDARGKFEKDWKATQRELKQRADQVAALEAEINNLRTTVNRPDPGALESEFYTKGPEFVSSRLAEMEQRFQNALMHERVASSREMAMDKYEDFLEAEAAFFEAAQRDPSLLKEIKDSRLPAMVAYKKGKEVLAGSVAKSAADDRIAKLESEIEKLRAGRDGGQTTAGTETEPAAEQKPSVPRSNAGLRSSGVGKTNSWAGPTPINNVFGRRRANAR